MSWGSSEIWTKSQEIHPLDFHLDQSDSYKAERSFRCSSSAFPWKFLPPFPIPSSRSTLEPRRLHRDAACPAWDSFISRPLSSCLLASNEALLNIPTRPASRHAEVNILCLICLRPPASFSPQRIITGTGYSSPASAWLLRSDCCLIKTHINAFFCFVFFYKS